MRKTILYFVILAVMAAGVWYVFFKSKDTNVFGGSEAGFTIADTGNIGKIFLSERGGSTITLERRPDNGWRVNNQYDALNSTVQGLLETLRKQVAEAPVSDAEYNPVIKTLASNAVKTEVYDRKGNKLAVFYVGNEVHNFLGTYMLMEGAKRPYIVNIPGFEGTLRVHYTTRMSDWRDRTIFNVDSTDIKSISIKYFDHPLNSFVMKQDGGKVTVELDSNLRSVEKNINMDRAKRYLGFFKNINCVGYVNGAQDMDTILTLVPKYCTVDVTAKNNQTKHIEVYWHPLDRRSKNQLTPVQNFNNDYDADRFYAIINNNKDTVVIQRFVFNKIFRAGPEFYQQASQFSDLPPADTMKVIQPK
ncbi:DUF4340 domain-containing protein [Chitinophagaceae bacterium MMS25-I14]